MIDKYRKISLDDVDMLISYM